MSNEVETHQLFEVPRGSDGQIRVRDPAKEFWADGGAWFTRDGYSFHDAAGLPVALRRRAAETLSRLYNSEVCRTCFENGDGAVIAPLYREGDLSVNLLIEIGLDLEAVKPWDDTGLLGELRNQKGFWQAAVELSIWANAVRAGYPTLRSPRTASDKRPDLAVYLGLQRYIIEVKTLVASDLDRVRDEIEHHLRHLMIDLITPGHVAVIRSNTQTLDEIRREPLEFRKRIPDLCREVRGCAATIQSRGGALGSYALGSLGHVEVSNHDFPTAMSDFVPFDPEERVVRIRRLVREGVDQLASTARGVVLVHVTSDVDAAEVQAALARSDLAQPIRNSTCDLVVLRIDGMDSQAIKRRVGFPVWTRHGAVSPGEAQLIEALAYRHFRDPHRHVLSRMVSLR